MNITSISGNNRQVKDFNKTVVFYEMSGVAFQKKEAGFSHALHVFIVLVVGIIGCMGWRVCSHSNKNTPTTHQTVSRQPATATQTVHAQPDSASTIDSPQQIATKDGRQYFIYGAPAGQNNASPKKILITLHGTGGSAERDYEIWKPRVKDTRYALASLNWWDGSGDQPSDYGTPESVNAQIHDFLSAQGYTKNDLVVFEGFSRGSANTYPIVAYDRAGPEPIIDVVVSSSGGVENNYYTMTTHGIAGKAQGNIFTGVYWILACGGRDPHPARAGCPGMDRAKKFVADKGATVLGVLSDPNAGHGALNTSALDLTTQMFKLIDRTF